MTDGSVDHVERENVQRTQVRGVRRWHPLTLMSRRRSVPARPGHRFRGVWESRCPAATTIPFRAHAVPLFDLPFGFIAVFKLRSAFAVCVTSRSSSKKIGPSTPSLHFIAIQVVTLWEWSSEIRHPLADGGIARGYRCSFRWSHPSFLMRRLRV